MNKFLLMLAAMATVGCVEVKSDTGAADTGVEDDVDTDDTDDTDDTVIEVGATVDWVATAITVSVTGPDDAMYDFGMAEVGPDNGDDYWTGEDCIYGYATSNGSVLGPYCHELDATGGTITYGGDPANLLAGTSVFGDSSFEPAVAYYMEDQSDPSACWIWGADSNYYAGLGCVEL